MTQAGIGFHAKRRAKMRAGEFSCSLGPRGGPCYQCLQDKGLTPPRSRKRRKRGVA